MRPKPVGTAAEFAPYAARGTLEASDEFLKAYPETPIHAAVYAHLASRLPKDNKARDAVLERLLGVYPGFSDSLSCRGASVMDRSAGPACQGHPAARQNPGKHFDCRD